jgi:hypothetical protein
MCQKLKSLINEIAYVTFIITKPKNCISHSKTPYKKYTFFDKDANFLAANLILKQQTKIEVLKNTSNLTLICSRPLPLPFTVHIINTQPHKYTQKQLHYSSHKSHMIQFPQIVLHLKCKQTLCTLTPPAASSHTCHRIFSRSTNTRRAENQPKKQNAGLRLI